MTKKELAQKFKEESLKSHIKRLKESYEHISAEDYLDNAMAYYAKQLPKELKFISKELETEKDVKRATLLIKKRNQFEKALKSPQALAEFVVAEEKDTGLPSFSLSVESKERGRGRDL